MTTSIAVLSQLRNDLESEIASSADAEAIERLTGRLNDVKAATYRRSPREPMASVIDERDAADDALGTIFELMRDGYVPAPGVIEEFDARRDACQLEIDARRTAPRADWSGRLEATEEMRLR